MTKKSNGKGDTPRPVDRDRFRDNYDHIDWSNGMKESELVYLACPYTHIRTSVRVNRFHYVNAAAGALIADGMLVFSPISHSHPITIDAQIPSTWAYWEKHDRAMLEACSKLVVLTLDGWKESVGVQAEIAIAKELGIPVEYMSQRVI